MSNTFQDLRLDDHKEVAGFPNHVTIIISPCWTKSEKHEARHIALSKAKGLYSGEGIFRFAQNDKNGPCYSHEKPTQNYG